MNNQPTSVSLIVVELHVVTRSFQFTDEVEFIPFALYFQAQLEKLQNEIAQAAKKTGIASAAKLATIQPKKDVVSDFFMAVAYVTNKIACFCMLDSYEEAPGLSPGSGVIGQHVTSFGNVYWFSGIPVNQAFYRFGFNDLSLVLRRLH